MRSYKFLMLIFSATIILSCGDKIGGPSINKKLAAEIINPLTIEKGGEFSSLDQIRSQANALIDSRVSKETKALSFLTYGFWAPEFVYNDKKMSGVDEYLGHWIDFKDDFTYEYGYYADVLGTGKFHYRSEDNQFIMLDSDTEKEPKIWTAPYNGDIMALVGTHELGINNGMQIKMVPQDNKPVKAAPAAGS